MSLSLTMNYAADTDMLENVCNENNRDVAHLVAAVRAPVHVGPGVLAKYIGRYAFRDGSSIVAGFMGMNQSVTLVNDRLYLNALPLIPLSETTFESTGANVEFVVDASGKVTRLVLGQAEGEATYDLKR